MTVVVSVSRVFQQCDNQQNYKYDTVVDRITILCVLHHDPLYGHDCVFAGSSLPLHMPA